MPNTALTLLSLTDREIQAVFRGLIDYRRILELSAMKDARLVSEEIAAVDAVSEKISLAFHYPAGAHNVSEA